MVCGKCISQRSPMSNVCSLHGFSLPRQTRSNSFCNINCHHYWVELHSPPLDTHLIFFFFIFVCPKRISFCLSLTKFGLSRPNSFFFIHLFFLFSDLMNHILLPSFIPWTFTNVLCLFQRTFLLVLLLRIYFFFILQFLLSLSSNLFTLFLFVIYFYCLSYSVSTRN